MIFLPVRQYLSAGTRIYDKLNTADWWWETQKQLLLSITIVPIILASNKTQLTQHISGKKAWPLYILIENIKLHIQQFVNQPALLLLAYLLIHIFNNQIMQLAVQYKTFVAILKCIF